MIVKMNTHILSLLPAEFEHEIESCGIIEENNWKAVGLIHTECDASQMCDKLVSRFSSSSAYGVFEKTYPLGFNSPGGGVPLGRSPGNFHWMSMDGQGT